MWHAGYMGVHDAQDDGNFTTPNCLRTTSMSCIMPLQASPVFLPSFDFLQIENEDSTVPFLRCDPGGMPCPK